MEIDRRAFLATLGTVAAVEAMPAEARADALEHHTMEMLDQTAEGLPVIRRGAGSIFGAGRTVGGTRTLSALAPMPEKPTLVDFFKLRFAPATHVLQSATARLKTANRGGVLACLLHDVVLNPDQGRSRLVGRADDSSPTSRKEQLGDPLSSGASVLPGRSGGLRVSGSLSPDLRQGLHAAAVHRSHLQDA